MKTQTHILSVDEKERIHAQSLHLLAETGIRFHGERALPLLERHGARVDWEERLAFIPAELVAQALDQAPKQVRLGGRNPAYSYTMPSSETRYCIDGTATLALDFESGERRYGTRKDIENGLRVFQQLEVGAMAWAPVCAADTPAHSRALHEFFTMARFSSRHGQHELHTVEQAPYLVEGLAAIAGSEEALREQLLYSLIYCPVAPLTHDGPMLDAYLELGQAGLPVMIMPMPVTGTTGPASLFSNLVVANMELLSSLVVFQLAHPGRALIYSSATGSVDFRSGAYLGGTAEMGLQSAALVEMARHYDLPASSAGMTSDARQPGAEAVLEKVVTTLPPVLAGADLIIGLGEIESDQLLVLEQLVVDQEIARFCQRLRQGVDSSPACDLAEDIARVGPGGHYLSSRNTRRLAHSREFFVSALEDHHSYEAWLSLGQPTMYSKARQVVREILEGPVVDPLPEAVEARLEEILRRADRDLKN